MNFTLTIKFENFYNKANEFIFKYKNAEQNILKQYLKNLLLDFSDIPAEVELKLLEIENLEEQLDLNDKQSELIKTGFFADMKKKANAKKKYYVFIQKFASSL